MKKRLTTLCLMAVLLTPIYALGQTFGVKAGLNLAKMDRQFNGESLNDNVNWKPGYTVGLTAEFPLVSLLSVETGVSLSAKGFIIKTADKILGISYTYEFNHSPLYLDIPLNLKVSKDLGVANSGVYATFGPYMGIGIAGKTVTTTTVGETVTTKPKTISWGSTNDNDLKRLDVGLSFGAGVEISGIQIGATYGIGLLNIHPTGENTSITNQLWSITLGYRF